jgi:hypothetical protein
VQHPIPSSERSESGIALLLTILMLLLVSAIGVSSLNRAGDELTVGGASRRQVRNVAAAEAALKLVGSQLAAAQTGTAPPSTPIYLPSFVSELGGRNTLVRTGTIADGGTPQPIQPIGTGSVSGGDLRVNYAPARRLVYRVNVVATDPSGGNVQLQAQFSVRQN